MSTNAKAFRAALGSFATGVTIVTTADADGRPVGVTASSFNSLSLDPPLVLWSLAKTSSSLAAFQRSGEFAIHVLTSKQEALSSHFAKKSEDKFAGVDWTPGEAGVPILAGCAARFRCRTAHQHEGGDHIIFVGEVLDFAHRAEPPLLFHSGAYAEARERAGGPPASGVDLESGRINNNFLLFLLTRAQFQVTQPITELRASVNMSREEQIALLLLGMNGSLTLDDLVQRLAFTGMPPSVDTMTTMHRRGWIEVEGDSFTPTLAGRELFLEILARGKAFEDDLLACFTPQEIAEARRFLQRLIEFTSGSQPPLWD